MPDEAQAPPAVHEYEGDYRPAGNAAIDPTNPRVVPVDAAYLMKLTDTLNTTLDFRRC